MAFKVRSLPARSAAFVVLMVSLTACGSRSSAVVATTPSPTPSGLPAALYGGSDRAGSVIDPKHAEAVVLAMWPLREEALHDRNLAMLRKLETGPALSADVAQACFCPPHVIRPERDPMVVVERQSSFPAVFFASVVTVSHTTDQQGNPNGFLGHMVFTRADRESPWLVTLWTGHTISSDSPNPYDAHWDPTDHTLPGNYAFALAPPVPAGIDVPKLPEMLGAELQSWVEHGVGIPATPFADGTGKSIRPEVEDWKARGLTEHVAFHSDPSVSTYQFGLFNDVDLACSALDYAKTLTPSTPGRIMHQPLDQSNWGPTVAPGDYESITYVGVYEPCFYIQPSPEKVIVFSNGFLLTGATGKAVNNPAMTA